MRFTASHSPGPARSHPVQRLLAIALGLVAALTMMPVAATIHAGAPDPGGSPSGEFYVTTTTPESPSINVDGITPVCIRDAPFISYTIVPVGFTPAVESATLVIRTLDGTIVDTETVDSFSGQIIWPGATVDAAGNATDWPGWRRAADGVSWEPDPTDEQFRDGLMIDVTVEGAPPATATVSYVPDDSDCANPPDPERPTTTTPCVPGQNGDADPSDDCDLVTTGSNPNSLLMIGGATLLAGLLVVAATRRRRNEVGVRLG